MSVPARRSCIHSILSPCNVTIRLSDNRYLYALLKNDYKREELRGHCKGAIGRFTVARYFEESINAFLIMREVVCGNAAYCSPNREERMAKIRALAAERAKQAKVKELLLAAAEAVMYVVIEFERELSQLNLDELVSSFYSTIAGPQGLSYIIKFCIDVIESKGDLEKKAKDQLTHVTLRASQFERERTKDAHLLLQYTASHTIGIHQSPLQREKKLLKPINAISAIPCESELDLKCEPDYNQNHKESPKYITVSRKAKSS